MSNVNKKTVAYINWDVASGPSSFQLIKKAVETKLNGTNDDVELIHITSNTIPSNIDASQVDVVIVDAHVTGIWSQFSNLGLILVAWAGVDRLLRDETFPRHVPVVRLVDDALTQRMGQIALTHVLNHHRDMYTFAAQQKAKLWNKKPNGRLPKPMHEYRIGVLGVGVLGKEVLCQVVRNGFTNVVGWGTSERILEMRKFVETSDGGVELGVQEVVISSGGSGLMSVFETCDVVINVLPSTPNTRQLIGFEELSCMKRPGSVFVNLGRGSTVVQADVIKALDSDAVGLNWAVLDVFEVEPLPVDSPLWSHERVIVTPHMAALTDYTSAAQTLADTLAQFYDGKVALAKGLVDMTKNFGAPASPGAAAGRRSVRREAAKFGASNPPTLAQVRTTLAAFHEATGGAAAAAAGGEGQEAAPADDAIAHDANSVERPALAVGGEAQQTIRALERSLGNQKHDAEKKVASLEARNDKLEQSLNAAYAKIEALEEHRAFLLKLEESQKNTIREKSKEFEKQSQLEKSRILQLESSVREISEKLSITEENLNDSLRRQELELRKSKREVESYKHKYNTMDIELQRANTSKTLAFKQVGELQMKIAELESQLAYSKHDGGSGSSLFNAEAIKKQLNEQSTYIHNLETSNSHLKAENQQLRSMHQSSTAAGDGGGGGGGGTTIITPLTLARLLANERLEEAREKEAVAESLGELKVLREKERDAEIEAEELKRHISELEQKCAFQMSQIKRIEKGRELSVKECTFLREQMTALHFAEDGGAANSSALVAELEALLASYKNQLYEMEQKLAKFQTENARLQVEVENFDNQILELERALGQGAFDPDKIKILQLAENPEATAFAIRKELLDTLRAENDALKARLLGSEYGAMVPVEVVRSLELEGRRLLGIIEEKDKRNSRFKDVFTQKSQEFKEAVFSLLGYKLEFQESRVRLISSYTSPQDTSSFLFSSQENDCGTMQIVGGSRERTHELNQLREHYVVQHGSVPAFLASSNVEWLAALDGSQGRESNKRMTICIYYS
ncbi:hypothetical protein BDR26DRAFT_932299 [Obelidium mucronatum]|nr:hypothetical protein BDR26DRAFT_932299 [Obelidium mucronatum]